MIKTYLSAALTLGGCLLLNACTATNGTVDSYYVPAGYYRHDPPPPVSTSVEPPRDYIRHRHYRHRRSDRRIDVDAEVRPSRDRRGPSTRVTVGPRRPARGPSTGVVVEHGRRPAPGPSTRVVIDHGRRPAPSTRVTVDKNALRQKIEDQKKFAERRKKVDELSKKLKDHFAQRHGHKHFG